MNNYLNNLFTKSLFEEENILNPTSDALKWIKEQNRKVKVSIREIPFSELKNWSFREGALRHDSGKFFSIDGIRASTNYGKIHEWEQPIINQPEIGYLGFITKEFKGVLHFLMQAKIEPGNINYVQLSPTLQATKSNYSQVHKGNIPAYLNFFREAKKEQVLLDQLQSEQGARFLKKRNRNIIIKVEEDIEILENFIWLTLGQVKDLMKIDNIVNMDSRTVISGIPLLEPPLSLSDDLGKHSQSFEQNNFNRGLYASCAYNAKCKNSLDDIIKFITSHKCNLELDIEKIPLSSLDNWVITDRSIHHKEKKYFEIIATEIEIGNREVVNWSQPMVKPVQEGICALICKNIKGVMHFIMQAKLECGNFDIIELAPTVQCLTDNYRTKKSIEALPFLKYVLNAQKSNLIFDTYQSEEGGRFFKEQNRSMIIFDEENIPLELPENYVWMTYNQIQMFLKHNNYLNIQARSLLSSLSFRL
ncbi:NDP-hexose 2,3-dehydratase family protein [Gramella sp. AN32]|uniref:NDP-hexose 2,3-dehydratase family protein n=1 Tax=Christiangramia antarctica TaxID=2058158 RepID=A0ABW5X0X4_9FLAO|nr:NDP-hexose 2,3-dehydratase family protein [Gramella sp. AN32]MCM4157124.1 NDP-hexose 2,3-dehydratase [Gramella sp. AN32]